MDRVCRRTSGLGAFNPGCSFIGQVIQGARAAPAPAHRHQTGEGVDGGTADAGKRRPGPETKEEGLAERDGSGVPVGGGKAKAAGEGLDSQNWRWRC